MASQLPVSAICTISRGVAKTASAILGTAPWSTTSSYLTSVQNATTASNQSSSTDQSATSSKKVSQMVADLGLGEPVTMFGTDPRDTVSTSTSTSGTSTTSAAAASGSNTTKLTAPSKLKSQPKREKPLETKAVPSTRIGRAAGFSSMFIQVGLAKLTASSGSETMIPKEGHQLIASTLCRMRGAVLKLGQMLSIQDEKTVPPAVTAMFQQVRDSAFAMPSSQLNQAMSQALGGKSDWRAMFEEFDEEPLAAASIGQVHFAKLRQAGDASSVVPVAVKVQYPGVAKSIDSDVANLRMLMKMNILPSGLFVGNILTELKNELSQECQYTLEAAKQERYRKLVLGDDKLSNTFYVPKVFPSMSSDQILCSEFVQGVTIDKLKPGLGLVDLPQETRNKICQEMMRLTLTELFVWRFMQTDPNYANFLVEPETARVNLLDFGAAREYSAEFVQDYLDVVSAAQAEDSKTVIEKSIRLGFLTGKECKEMLQAHSSSVLTLGRPFRGNCEDGSFDFTKENLPEQLQKYVPTMLKLRLRPPPSPIYSLHRRISGTILLSTQLKAKYSVKELFADARAAAAANKGDELVGKSS